MRGKKEPMSNPSTSGSASKKAVRGGGRLLLRGPSGGGALLPARSARSPIAGAPPRPRALPLPNVPLASTTASMPSTMRSSSPLAACTVSSAANGCVRR